MPIYEYRCQGCGHELEAMQKFSDAILTDCPACRNPTLTKLVSAAGFQLKGSGWYATDFKGGSRKDKTKDKTEKSESGTSGSDTAAGAKKNACGAGTCGCH